MKVDFNALSGELQKAADAVITKHVNIARLNELAELAGFSKVDPDVFRYNPQVEDVYHEDFSPKVLKSPVGDLDKVFGYGLNEGDMKDSFSQFLEYLIRKPSEGVEYPIVNLGCYTKNLGPVEGGSTPHFDFYFPRTDVPVFQVVFPDEKRGRKLQMAKLFTYVTRDTGGEYLCRTSGSEKAFYFSVPGVHS